MTSRRAHESPRRSVQNFAGTRMAHDAATVRKNSVVSRVQSGPEYWSGRSATHSAVARPAKATVTAIDHDSSIHCCRGVTAGRAVRIGSSAAGRGGPAAPARAARAGTRRRRRRRRRAGFFWPTASTSRAISAMLA